MDIFLNLDGTAQIITPVPIYQGSNAVTDIVVQGFMPQTTAMELYFIMTDQDRTQVGPFVMSPVIPSSGTDGLNYWKWSLIKSITTLTGTVNLIINAISGAPSDPISGTQNTTSYSCAFDVTAGVLPSPPIFPPEQDQWELILQYMERAFVAADEAMVAVSPVQIRTQAVTLQGADTAYTNLQLIYDGVLIKEWDSAAQTWTQISPNPTEPEASKWIYNFIFGLPKGETGENGINATVQWGVNAPSPISTLQWIVL